MRPKANSKRFPRYRAERGEMAELAEGARLLSECRVKSPTEGSNPSLSAILIHSPISLNPHQNLTLPRFNTFQNPSFPSLRATPADEAGGRQ